MDKFCNVMQLPLTFKMESNHGPSVRRNWEKAKQSSAKESSLWACATNYNSRAASRFWLNFGLINTLRLLLFTKALKNLRTSPGSPQQSFRFRFAFFWCLLDEVLGFGCVTFWFNLISPDCWCLPWFIRRVSSLQFTPCWPSHDDHLKFFLRR